jgi:hypothetical protein
MARYITAQEIINRASIEVGLGEQTDPFGSSDPKVSQLRALLTSCGQDLVEAHPWEYMRREHSITTSSADSGAYDLPDDFGYLLDDTAWDRNENLPVSGPLTPQQWQHLKGRDFSNSTIYLSFRIMENKYNVYPDNPVPDGQQIYFEYISRYWLISEGGSAPDQDEALSNGDLVLFKPSMVVNYLKYKFLDAKGFDSSSALEAFAKSFQQASDGNKGAPTLNAGQRYTGIPLLDYRNIPITNYGS